MGLFERRRHEKKRRLLNWDMVVATGLMGHELLLADADGIDDNELKGDRAADVRDTVLDAIGGWTVFTEAVIDAFDLDHPDGITAALDRAQETTGYNATRRRLFPHLAQDYPAEGS